MPSIGALTVHRIRDLGGQTSGHEDVLVFNHRELGSSVLKTCNKQT